MATEKQIAGRKRGLRRRAEAFVTKHPATIKDTPPGDIRNLVEELRIHQVELEMQNEELRRAQLELEAERDRYTNLYDFSPVGYFTITDKGIILEANLTGAGMLGIDRRQLIKHTFSEFIWSEDQDDYYRLRLKIKESKERQTCELRLVKQDDAHFYALMECIPIVDENENASQIRAAVTDITQRKQAEQKIQDYQFQLKRLASELTLTEERLKKAVATQLHDRISQSLAGARMNLNTLRRSLGNPAQQKMVTDVMTVLANTLEESQSLTLQLSYPTLNVLGLSRAVEAWLGQEIASKHGLHVRFSDDGLDKPLHEDVRAVLFRSICEVLNNIVKHAQAQNVSVRIWREERNIVVAVADDGIGFDPQVLKAKGSGFGLLSILESLERLEGRLDIERREGCGSLVTLRLPLMAEEPLDA